MVPVVDRRFEGGVWPFSLEIPVGEADTWLEYFSTECARRGWSCSGIGQLETRENSGTINVRPQSGSDPLVDLVWERKKEGPLVIRARAAAGATLSDQEISVLLDQVTSHCRNQVTEQFFRRGHLRYDGRASRGEIWLSDRLRLGPPSVLDETAVFGPRVLIMDALIDAISWSHANAVFGVQLREVAAFLSVVMRIEVRSSPVSERGWTWAATPTGQLEPEVRQLGYVEREHPQTMPAPGLSPPLPLAQVTRPILDPTARIQTDDRQVFLPNDTVDLWHKFMALAPEQRKQFVQVSTLWQASLSLWRDYPSSSFTLMVAAGEALKPPGQEYRDRKIYHVIEALLGRPQADALRAQSIRAHELRSQHIHTGDLKGWEFELHATMSTYRDPSFRQATDLLWITVSAGIIQWLSRGGSAGLSPSGRARRRRGFFRRLGIIALILLSGVALGWFLRQQLG